MLQNTDISEPPNGRVTGGWGEKSSETENRQSSEPSPKSAARTHRQLHAVFGGTKINVSVRSNL